MTEVTTTTPSADQLHISADTIDRITELAHASVAIQTYAGTDHLIVPDGYKHVEITYDIERAQTAPNRKKGIARLSDIDSFIQYAKDQNMQHRGYIYADPEACTLIAVFNDYRDDTATGWRDHHAVFQAEKSREFSTWLKNNKDPKEQEAFAIFLEDNIADIAEPSGETLLTIALTLQAKTEVNFGSSRRLDNGQVQLIYTENIDARAGTGNIDIPREFSIGVRLFKNGSGYKLRARLKYRLGGGKAKFWYELDRAENAIEDAFKDYITKAAEAGYTILLGKP